MTKQLEIAFEKARRLPPEEQDELARMTLQMVHASREDFSYELSEEDEAAIETGLAEADRGEFVSDEDLATILNKYRS